MFDIAGFMKTVPIQRPFNLHYLSLSTQVDEGTVFRKHTVSYAERFFLVWILTSDANLTFIMPQRIKKSLKSYKNGNTLSFLSIYFGHYDCLLGYA